jgi:hypothetical protein
MSNLLLKKKKSRSVMVMGEGMKYSPRSAAEFIRKPSTNKSQPKLK